MRDLGNCSYDRGIEMIQTGHAWNRENPTDTV